MKQIRIGLLVSMSFAASAQNIGIGTAIPGAKLDINGDLALRPGLITLSGVLMDNIDLVSTPFSFYNLLGSGFQNMGGFAGGKDGRIVTLHNNSHSTFYMLHNSPSSDSVNRINIPGGGTLGILSGGSVTMIYSRLISKWNVISSQYTSSQQSAQWNTNGNSNATPATNFIGTTDQNDFVIRTNNLERMRVNSSGNIGIGTASPYTKLTVQSATNSYGIVQSDGTNSVGTLVTANAGLVGTLTNVPLSFFTWGQAPKMTLLQNGNVGIGTITPQSDLHINPNGAGSLLIGTNRTAGGYTAIEMGISAQSNGYGYVQTIKASGSTWGNLVINESGGTVGIGTSQTYVNTKLTIGQNSGTGGNFSGVAATASGATYAALKGQGTNGADALVIDGVIRALNTEHRVAYRMVTQRTNETADGYLYDNFDGLPGLPDGTVTIRIENPICNGDPNAVIIYSFVGFYENNKNYQSYLIYDPVTQRWYVRYKYDTYGTPSTNHTPLLNILIIKQAL